MSATPGECAALLVESVPRLMAGLRRDAVERAPRDLTLAQFRVLGLVAQRDGATVSELAARLDVGLPAASKLAQGLVERGILVREADPADRRRAVLRLNPGARARMHRMRAETRRRLARRLRGLSPAEREHLARGLRALGRLLEEPGVGR